AGGLTSFIWPRSAPTTSTGDMPPISSVICFQLQPFSRLMSRIFSGELFASHGTPLGLPAWEKERLLGRAVEGGNGSGRAAHRPGQRDYAAASTHERLIDKVARHLAVTQADAPGRGRHEDDGQLLLWVHPEIRAVHTRPVEIAGGAGHGGDAVLAAHRDAQTEAVARGGPIHLVGNHVVESSPQGGPRHQRQRAAPEHTLN